MQYVDRFHSFDFLPVASNDNDDLLVMNSPEQNLSLILGMKREMRDANASDGLLLRSRKLRRRFQEVLDAERYITLRYFSTEPDSQLLRRLKRHILDCYLFPTLRKI